MRAEREKERERCCIKIHEWKHKYSMTAIKHPHPLSLPLSLSLGCYILSIEISWFTWTSTTAIIVILSHPTRFNRRLERMERKIHFPLLPSSPRLQFGFALTFVIHSFCFLPLSLFLFLSSHFQLVSQHLFPTAHSHLKQEARQRPE